MSEELVGFPRLVGLRNDSVSVGKPGILILANKKSYIYISFYIKEDSFLKCYN